MSAKVIAIVAWLVFQAGEPVADCVAPSPPERVFSEAPARPATPSCVNERTNRHTCSNRIINAYNQEMDAYAAAFDAHVVRINTYIEALNAYMLGVNGYTQCEQRRVAPQALIVG